MANLELITDKGYKDINPVVFGYESCKKSHHYGPALRTYWLIHFVVSGKGYFKIEDREYTVTEGNIFVIPPFVEIYYEADAQTPWEYIWIGFTMDKRVDIRFDDVMYLPKTQHIFESMKHCGEMTGGKTEFLCSKIWQLISVILDQRRETVGYIDKALSIVGSEYMTDIGVQEIADRIGLERTYFSKLFRTQTGISPKQYILKTRMELAADLIKNRGYSISVTALSVGYNDVYIFSKMFKRYYGISPSHFKEKAD